MSNPAYQQHVDGLVRQGRAEFVHLASPVRITRLDEHGDPIPGSTVTGTGFEWTQVWKPEPDISDWDLVYYAEVWKPQVWSMRVERYDRAAWKAILEVVLGETYIHRARRRRLEQARTARYGPRPLPRRFP